MDTEPTVWVEIPASWVLPQGEFTFLRDGTRGLVFGPVMAIEPTMPPPDAGTRAEQAEAALEAAEDLASRLRADHRAEIAEAETQIREAEATVARVKALAEDMRTWRSPHGIAVKYAQRIDEAIEPPAPVKAERLAVREFAARLDPRQEGS